MVVLAAVTQAGRAIGVGAMQHHTVPVGTVADHAGRLGRAMPPGHEPEPLPTGAFDGRLAAPVALFRLSQRQMRGQDQTTGHSVSGTWVWPEVSTATSIFGNGGRDQQRSPGRGHSGTECRRVAASTVMDHTSENQVRCNTCRSPALPWLRRPVDQSPPPCLELLVRELTARVSTFEDLQR